MSTRDESAQEKTEQTPQLAPPVHRRLLTLLNEAVRPEELVYEKQAAVPEGEGAHEVHREEIERPRIQRMDPAVAKTIIDARGRHFPLGFRNVDEVVDVAGLEWANLDGLLHHLSEQFFGRWSVFAQAIPRRGPGGYDGVVHAAMLRTGQVLFITADETTVLWNPDDPTPATFEDPANQPHQIPDAASGYSVLCGGHSFLSDGRLFVAGGGGYGPHHKAMWGYKFDPATKEWTRTAGNMAHHRWYPTVLTLGDKRIDDSHEVLVVCGHGAGDMEIYDETTDAFTEVSSGDVKPFPNLYPGLHLLPNHTIFYSGTGWASAGPGGGPFTGDDQSATFSFTGPATGVWTDIAPVASSKPDRTKGMSVLLLDNTAPYARVMAIGGSDPATNNTYELIDATAPSPTSNWTAPSPFPDGQRRSLASVVLLPDGTAFVCGGIQTPYSPCALFDPDAAMWSPMDALPSVRDYHSVALLLPTGQVMMAGWNNTSIEIFDPPYMFRGARPVISKAPSDVHFAQTFHIESPDAPSIDRVVLVRPMAVTHQTDTEQKVIELPIAHQGNPKKVRVKAPHGGHPHSLAQQGYYMMFALDAAGVPSTAEWVYLH
jgi:hypothetical protein